LDPNGVAMAVSATATLRPSVALMEM